MMEKTVITDHGTRWGKGDAEKKAAEAALKRAKEKLLIDPHADDDGDVWKKRYTRLTLTTEKPIDDEDGTRTATAAWKFVVEAEGSLPAKPPGHDKEVLDPKGFTDPCGEFLKLHGNFTITQEEAPHTRAKAFNKVIDEVHATIENQGCAVACPNKRAQLSVKLTERVSEEWQGSHELAAAGFDVEWHLQLYCFDTDQEKV